MKKNNHKISKTAIFVLKRLLPGYLDDSFIDDFKYLYSTKAKDKGRVTAGIWLWGYILQSSFRLIYESFRWSLIMFKNYMKIAFRMLKKQKIYSLINISGLAAGISCCVFILLYVAEELSYDKFHKDVDRIYRVTMEIESETASQPYTMIAWPVAPALKDNFPQVEYAVRLYTWGDWLIGYKNKKFYEEKFMWADPEIFSVLTFPFIEGDPHTALNQPNSIVISERTAVKYFSGEEPLGKLLNVNERKMNNENY